MSWSDWMYKDKPDPEPEGQKGKPSPAPAPKPISPLSAAVPITAPTTISGAPSPSSAYADEALVAKIKDRIEDGVPLLHDLMDKAESLKPVLPTSDLGQRIAAAATVNGVKPEQLAAAVATLKQSLAGIAQESADKVVHARAEQIEGPQKEIEQADAEKQKLIERINAIDAANNERRAKIAESQGRIDTGQRKFDASIAQVGAWISEIARLLGVPANN